MSVSFPKSIISLGLNLRQMDTGYCPEDRLWIMQEVLRIEDPQALTDALLRESKEVIDAGHMGIGAFIISKEWFEHSLRWMYDHGMYVPDKLKKEYREKYPSWAHFRDRFLQPRNPIFFFNGAPVYVTMDLQSRTMRTTRVMGIPILQSSEGTAN